MRDTSTKKNRSFLWRTIKVMLIVVFIALVLIVLYFVFPQTWTEPDDYIEGLHGEKISLVKGDGQYVRGGSDHFILADGYYEHVPLSKTNPSNRKRPAKRIIKWRLYPWFSEPLESYQNQEHKRVKKETVFTIVDSHWVCETGFTFDQNDTHYLVLHDSNGVISYIRTHFIDQFNNPNFSIQSAFHLINKKGLKCWIKGF